ncbi:nucleotidyltransferase substrate binding protein [Desulfonatronum parangueonense]
MNMIKSRNLSSHTYSESLAKKIVGEIIAEYYPEFLLMRQTMDQVHRDDRQ